MNVFFRLLRAIGIYILRLTCFCLMYIKDQLRDFATCMMFAMYTPLWLRKLFPATGYVWLLFAAVVAIFFRETLHPLVTCIATLAVTYLLLALILLLFVLRSNPDVKRK